MQDFIGLSGWIRMNPVLVDTSAKYDPAFDLPVGQYEPEKVRVLIVADGPISYFGRR